jgi:hypothetical protein
MRHGIGRGRGLRVALAAVAAVVLVLALAQVFLPRIAVSRIESRIDRYGTVRSVSVSAWPAVELLWGHVGSVEVKAGSLRLSTADAAKLLWEARGTGSMDVSAQAVQLGSLRVSDAQLRKRGDALTAQALVGEAAVKAALPTGFGLRLLHSGAGQVEVQATGGLFGLDASVDAVAQARAGKLVAHPLGLFLEGLQLTLFSDPHVYVEGVGASVRSHSPLSYLLTMSARLR